MDPTQFNSQNWLRAVALNNARTGRTQPYGQPAAVPEANAQTAPGGLNQQQMDAMGDAASPLVVAATPDRAPSEASANGAPPPTSTAGKAAFPEQQEQYNQFTRDMLSSNLMRPLLGKTVVTDPEAFANGFGGASAIVPGSQAEDIAKRFGEFDKMQGDKEKLDFAKQQLAQQGNLAAAGQAIQLSGQQMTAAQQAAANALAQQQLGLEKTKVEQEGQKIGLLRKQPWVGVAAEMLKAGQPVPPALAQLAGSEIESKGPPLPGMTPPPESKPGNFFNQINQAVASAPDLSKIPTLVAQHMGPPGGRTANEDSIDNLVGALRKNPDLANSNEAMQVLAGKIRKGGYGDENQVRTALQRNLIRQGVNAKATNGVVKMGNHYIRHTNGGFLGRNGVVLGGPQGDLFWQPRGLGANDPTTMIPTMTNKGEADALANGELTSKLLSAFDALNGQ